MVALIVAISRLFIDMVSARKLGVVVGVAGSSRQVEYVIDTFDDGRIEVVLAQISCGEGHKEGGRYTVHCRASRVGLGEAHVAGLHDLPSKMGGRR
jgi:hypothetical protein